MQIDFLTSKKLFSIVPNGHIVTHDLHAIQRFVARVSTPELSFSRASTGQTVMHGASSHLSAGEPEGSFLENMLHSIIIGVIVIRTVN